MKTSARFRGSVCFASILIFVHTFAFGVFGAAGDVDLSFNASSGVTYPVSVVVVQPDGKVLIGSPLTFINGTNRYASARLNADGSRDNTFVSDTFIPNWTHLFQNVVFNDAEVAVVAVQSDGKVLVGGVAARLCALGEEECQNHYSSFVTRLNPDGSHDTNFTPFIGDGGLSVVQIPQVKAVVAQPDGKVVVGYVGYGYVRGIIRLNANGTRDTNFNTSIGSGFGVDSIVLQGDGKLLIGGPFNTVNGTDRNALARLNSNGSLDHGFTPAAGVGGSPLALQPDGKVLVRGYARLNADGSLDNSFNQVTGLNGAVRSIALQSDGKFLIGGDFTTVNDVVRPYLARLYGDAAPSLSITRSNAQLIVSWPFPSAGFVLQQNATLNSANWTAPSEPVADDGTSKFITVNAVAGHRFYRLVKP